MRSDNARVFSGVKPAAAQKDSEMRRRSNSYTGYSIACAIVWAVILAVVSAVGDSKTTHTFVLIFGGWWIGWLSATIARAVYPPPKPRQTHRPVPHRPASSERVALAMRK